jgi:multicomponent Na+:H+ antiporter subunit D
VTAHLPALIVVVPLFIAVLLPLVSRFNPFLARLLNFASYSVVLGCSVMALMTVLENGRWHYEMGGWAPPWGIEYVIDPLSGGMAVLVSFMALLACVYLDGQRQEQPQGGATLFDSLFLLLLAGLLGIILTGDVFNLYVFLEISSIAGYGLLASGGIRGVVATFRYLLLGTVAASFYLLGIGYLYALTGTLNMADLSLRVPELVGTAPFSVAVTFIVIGLAIKMAVFPLHGWQPDAYAYAPPAVTGFIAAVMSKVSAYALFRILFFVLLAEGAAGHAIAWLGWVAVLAMLAGSILALAQTDVRRMLAYSSVSQMGYILLGFSLANTSGLTGALFHILNHAVMKGCLFLAVGGVLWRTGGVTVDDFVGMGRRQPLAMAALTAGALSMVGLPPTAGFFSKWYLVQGSIESGQWIFVVAIATSSFLSAAYFFRLLERIYFRESVESELTRDSSDVLPLKMLGPVLLLGGMVFVLGAFSFSVVSGVIGPALPELGLGK